MILVDTPQFEEVVENGLDILEHRPTTYFEFGCGFGTSLLSFHRKMSAHGINNIKYCAFDGFCGLPIGAEEESGGVFKTGMFTCPRDEFNRRVAEIPKEQLIVIDGMFDQTLDVCKDGTKEILAASGIVNTTFVMVDCDLKSSTTYALNFLTDYLDGECILIFDDWHALKSNGQKAAFDSWLSVNKDISAFKLSEYKFNGNPAGMAFYIKRSV